MTPGPYKRIGAFPREYSGVYFPAMSSGKPRPARAIRTLERVRDVLSSAPVTERAMFGGHCFLLNGNMAAGVTGDGKLMVRVGPERFESLLAKRYARPMDITGRPMRGFLFIDPPGYSTTKGLRSWLAPALDFAGSLPPK